MPERPKHNVSPGERVRIPGTDFDRSPIRHLVPRQRLTYPVSDTSPSARPETIALMPRLWACALVGLILLVPSPAVAQLVGSGFSSPLYGTTAPDSPNTMYVVQQGGQIRPLNLTTGTIGSTPLLSMSTVSGSNFISGGEQGLLALAFHPNYATNGLMYVQYTYNNSQSGGGIRIEQYHVSGGVAEAASRLTVLQWDHDPANGNTNHNGGWIGFNPLAGGAAANNLYITTGDGGGGNDPSNNAQNKNAFQGKLLRLNVSATGLTAAGGYTIPSGNMTGTGVKPELYSYGLRNSFRASFDRGTGNMYIGDVGQNTREEINFIANGASGGQNFGWRLREGFIANPAGGIGGAKPADNVDPIHDYTHSIGGSVTGGYVYRGPAKDAAGIPLDGTYVFGDFISGRIWSFKYDGTSLTDYTERTTEFGFTAGTRNFSSFVEGADGALYVIDYGNGQVFRIVPVPEPATVGLVVVGALVGVRALARLRARSTRQTA
jgi:hypothetical protein